MARKTIDKNKPEAPETTPAAPPPAISGGDVKSERRGSPRKKKIAPAQPASRTPAGATKKSTAAKTTKGSSTKRGGGAQTAKELLKETFEQASAAVETLTAGAAPVVEVLASAASSVASAVAESMSEALPPIESPLQAIATVTAASTGASKAVTKTVEPKSAVKVSKKAPSKATAKAQVITPAAPAATTVPVATEPPMTAENFSLLTADDLYFFNEGTHTSLYEKLGAHRASVGGVGGTYFAVWAPNAAAVSVFGEFNNWDKSAHPLRLRSESGIWEGFLPGVDAGTTYKYHVVSKFDGYSVDKADPFAFHAETPPQTASVVAELTHQWNDDAWMKSRAERNALDAPISIYEVHLGSWRRAGRDGERQLTYRELASALTTYVKEMGFTHVELMPVMEHPFYGSWGYQTTGLFAPTSRYGSPQDFMFFVDYLHQHDIGVILDWVPSHFPTDEHGLSYFDGTHLYEHADPRQGFHPDWKSLIFNYGRNEVRSVLASSAAFWLDKFHIDGLRVDAVASMLYLDYSRKQGEWIPNQFGGRENIEAVGFLRRLNEDMYTRFPGIQMIAEESTAWPMVSRPSYVGGLGFGMKWDMGWMHDTLRYMSQDPIHRRFHHNSLTFRMMYAYTENFILPLSHDEVVHGKGSLINKMPGDDWQRFANLRLLFAYMFGQPAKKLLFMGGEFGQWREWNHDRSLDWHLLDNRLNAGLKDWVRDLNHTYTALGALHEWDFKPEGFEWIDCNDSDQSVISFVRKGEEADGDVVVVLNFTPLVRYNYQIGVSQPGFWRELLNSDAPMYGGSGQGNLGGVEAAPVRRHGRPFSLNLTLPPLGALFLQRRANEDNAETEETEETAGGSGANLR